MLTLVLVQLLACSGDTKSGDASDTSGVESDLSCSLMNSGTDWEWTGECPQMTTPCDVEVDGCALTIDYEADGGMTMGMPVGGTIEGDTITFTDGDSVTGCVGTIEGADQVSGTCGDGCTFSLRRKARRGGGWRGLRRLPPRPAGVGAALGVQAGPAENANLA